MINIEWSGSPVLVSIAIIILIAIVRQYSKTFAAIAATCLSNIPLGMVDCLLWHRRSSGSAGQFSQAALLNLFQPSSS